ncbi:hypothetical protein OG257_01235 [Streptomyces sp. NBC_00683]|uniref:hypothetical protein n=1 Tax=Streptomyces sp. NBC_00683 TaxID=2903670 RepID=UPI002E35BA2E|nr:hypothetical protein [Streptomyces sp. NBC_00683]
MGQIDFGGMPPAMVNTSIELLATEVAPAIRKETRLHYNFRASSPNGSLPGA